MRLVSVIVPTRNRPHLLAEALQSVRNQTHAAAEVVVVDDGGDLPVDAAALGDCGGPPIRLVRNAQSMGLAFSRNRGVEAATGDYVIHLDDDDLLARDAIARAYTLLSHPSRPDLVFLGVAGFGSRAEHFNRAQHAAVERVRALGKGTEPIPGHLYFGRGLARAVLTTVPMAFQRVMLSRAKWRAVSELRWRAYGFDPATSGDDEAKRTITGPLRDAEWTIYAAAICDNTVLLDFPLYLQRCEGQGYSSIPENRELHMLQSIAIKTRLYEASRALIELAGLRKDIRRSLATAQFDTAYAYFQEGRRTQSWHHLRKAFCLQPHLSHLKFAVRTLLPPPNVNGIG